MDEVYTVCEDWGEGSGLQIWETDCNVSDPGQQCKCKWLLFAIFHLLLNMCRSSFGWHDDQCCEGTVIKKHWGVLICWSKPDLPAHHHCAQYSLHKFPHHWHHSYYLEVKILKRYLSRKSYFSKEWKGEEERLCTFPVTPAAASVACAALRAP